MLMCMRVLMLRYGNEKIGLFKRKSMKTQNSRASGISNQVQHLATLGAAILVAAALVACGGGGGGGAVGGGGATAPVAPTVPPVTTTGPVITPPVTVSVTCPNTNPVVVVQGSNANDYTNCPVVPPVVVCDVTTVTTTAGGAKLQNKLFGSVCARGVVQPTTLTEQQASKATVYNALTPVATNIADANWNTNLIVTNPAAPGLTGSKIQYLWTGETGVDLNGITRKLASAVYTAPSGSTCFRPVYADEPAGSSPAIGSAFGPTGTSGSCITSTLEYIVSTKTTDPVQGMIYKGLSSGLCYRNTVATGDVSVTCPF